VAEVSEVLVDSNVILDIVTEDRRWGRWSADRLAECAERSILAINPIVFGEVSIGFARIEELDDALPANLVERRPLPWEAAFLAGKCFLRYRRSGGRRTAPLPDFYIGAHAAVARMTLLTRDPRRYRTYFPTVRLIAPE
jgi:predicted nucleic acid-binding protein